MAGIVLSVLWALIVAGLTLARFRQGDVSRRFRTICVLFVIGLTGFWLSYAGLRGGPHGGRWSWVESLNGCYVYAFWIFGVFSQVYGLADRGFSLTILSDFLSAPSPARSRTEMLQRYAEGRGMEYVKRKRFTQLVHGGFVRRAGDRYVSTPLGLWVGRVCGWVQALYAFRETG